MAGKTYRLVLIICLSVLTSFSEKKPKILIIGDSISIGYTPYVKIQLVDDAIVVHNPGNAQHTGTGLEKVKEWIGNEDWDIIQFNWGLWDLCYRHPDSEVQGNRDKINGNITHTIEDYTSNLDSIVTILKQITDAKLIFITTTYVPKYEAGRFKKDVLKYNKAAKKIMKNHSVVVNNIYKNSVSIHKNFGKGPDDVHYTEEGYKKLGVLITKFLSDELKTLDK